jgi:DNA processing protein
MRKLAPGHPEWPAALDEIADPPKRLFTEGQPIDASAPMIAIVGTRRPTIAGVEIAQSLARGLAQGGFTIVSGMAVGIDAVAHQAALDAGGNTIAVLGCGLDVLYPRPNLKLRQRITENGCLLTEYEAGMQPTKFTFPQRNRIVAGLAVGVIVVEGSYRSGALITARRALENDRNVYAVPGSLRNPMSQGPNMLIARGEAQLVTNFKDICDDLAPSMVWSHSSETPQVEEDELVVLDLLDDSPSTSDALLRAGTFEPGQLALTLARLEVRGWAVRSPGGYALSTAGARVRSAISDQQRLHIG